MPRWQRSLLPAVLGADHADRGARRRAPAAVAARLGRRPDHVRLRAGARRGGRVARTRSTRPAGGSSIDVSRTGGLRSGVGPARFRSRSAVGTSPCRRSHRHGRRRGGRGDLHRRDLLRAAPDAAGGGAVVRGRAVYAALYTGAGGYRVGDLLAGIAPRSSRRPGACSCGRGASSCCRCTSATAGCRPSRSWRVQEARRAERDRIAREMHDVLAHRISLLTLHAGALEFPRRAARGDRSRRAR